MMNTFFKRKKNEMAIFEYKCDTCNHKADKIISYDKRKKSHPCPKCFNGTMEFVDKVHKGSFRLKGNGWYESDFKR